MTIAMFTNNYLPHVGGVARSIVTFTERYRARGHRVVLITPHEAGSAPDPDVVTVPSLHLINTADNVAVPLLVPGIVAKAIEAAPPDIVHAHHPFLLGTTAAVAAAQQNVPLVFTHHTMYEHYTHYAPVDSPQLKEFVKDLSTGYANLCDCVFAPTPSVAATIRARGVTAPIEVVPTGINTRLYRQGDGKAVRKEFGIPPAAFVVGYAGRLAPEKNLLFLLRALVRFLHSEKAAHALFVGSGPLEADLQDQVRKHSLADRVHFTGTLENEALADAYAAMNLFAFASVSETQGLVLLEAQAAGVPVAALDAPGARDVVAPNVSGWLVKKHRTDAFVRALLDAQRLLERQPARYRENAQAQAEKFSADRCAAIALNKYKALRQAKRPLTRSANNAAWLKAQRLLTAKWKLWENRLSAVYAAVTATSLPR
jgi:glycosyltransferase involved in cell wall biosynthesis